MFQTLNRFGRKEVGVTFDFLHNLTSKIHFQVVSLETRFGPVSEWRLSKRLWSRFSPICSAELQIVMRSVQSFLEPQSLIICVVQRAKQLLTAVRSGRLGWPNKWGNPCAIVQRLVARFDFGFFGELFRCWPCKLRLIWKFRAPTYANLSYLHAFYLRRDTKPGISSDGGDDQVDNCVLSTFNLNFTSFHYRP